MKVLVVLFLFVVCSESKKTKMYEISDEYKAKSYNNRQRFLVLHYTATNLQRSLSILTGDRVSSHYVVPEGPIDGKRKIYQLVPEERRAYTQGVSFWRGRNNLNDQGVSLEIVNLGFEDKKDGGRHWFKFAPYQIDSVIQMSKDIIKRYDIEPTNVFGHGDCAPGRKVDPGPLFPWKQLYENGVGAWPDDSDVQCFMRSLNDNVDVKEFQEGLAKYGYKVNTDGVITAETRNVVIAFQMHFRQTKFDGVIDKESMAILKALLKKYR